MAPTNLVSCSGQHLPLLSTVVQLKEALVSSSNPALALPRFLDHKANIKGIFICSVHICAHV